MLLKSEFGKTKITRYSADSLTSDTSAFKRRDEHMQYILGKYYKTSDCLKFFINNFNLSISRIKLVMRLQPFFFFFFFFGSATAVGGGERLAEWRYPHINEVEKSYNHATIPYSQLTPRHCFSRWILCSFLRGWRPAFWMRTKLIDGKLHHNTCLASEKSEGAVVCICCFSFPSQNISIWGKNKQQT